MRTTIDLPDSLFRAVKSTAARDGVHLKDYIAEALRDRLAGSKSGSEKPWMKFAGIAARNPKAAAEVRKIARVVAENFEQIDEEDWK